MNVLQAIYLMAFLSASTSNFTATSLHLHLGCNPITMSQEQCGYKKYTLSRWTWRSIGSMYWSNTSIDLLISHMSHIDSYSCSDFECFAFLHGLVGFAGRFQLHLSAVLQKCAPSLLHSNEFQQWTIQAKTRETIHDSVFEDLPSWCWKQQPSVRFTTQQERSRTRLKTSLSDPSNLFQHTQPTSSPGICVANLTRDSSPAEA